MIVQFECHRRRHWIREERHPLSSREPTVPQGIARLSRTGIALGPRQCINPSGQPLADDSYGTSS